MIEYVFRTKLVDEGETINIPDNARDVEIQYGERHPTNDENEWTTEAYARVCWLEKDGDSVL